MEAAFSYYYEQEKQSRVGRMKKSEALKILGLSNGASDDEIKKAHREKVRANHPDQFAQDPVKKASAEEETKKINEARDVLLSGRWEPEFGRGPAGYGSPYDPFGGYPRGSSGGGDAYDPFGGWPFSGQGRPQGGPAYVWTSWDTASDSPFNPFGGAAQPKQTPEEKRDEALVETKRDLRFLAVKTGVAIVLAVVRMYATALLSFSLLTVIYALWKRYGSCLFAVLVPLILMLAQVIMRIPQNLIAIVILAPIALIALGYDIWNIVKSYRAYRKLKKEVDAS